MTVKVIRDEYGTLHRVPMAPPYKTSKGLKMDGSPHIDVWWDRDQRHLAGELLMIRQEEASDRADVIVLTQGQAHDLMQAIAWAINKP